MKNYLAEFIGTYLLVAVVIGSGIMAEALANGNIAVALLGNTIATGAILFVIIKMFGPISGAHYNPVVSMVFLIRKELKTNDFIIYIIMQITGGMLAILSSHYIFELEILQVSKNIRGEFPLLISEIIATLGLLLTILFVRKNDEASVAIAVGLFITAGYWFTSSTSFANPAVTIARTLTDSFTGISYLNTPYYIAAELIGMLIAIYLVKKIFLNK